MRLLSAGVNINPGTFKAKYSWIESLRKILLQNLQEAFKT